MVALRGCQVLEVAQGLAGPFCGQYLAEAGADVIKVEPLGGDRARGWGPPFQGEVSAVFLALNLGKRSLALDLGREEGREVLGRLLSLADVVVEDLRVEEAEAAGLQYERLSQANPALVYCAIRDFSPEGPYGGQPGSELVYQALTDYLNSLGEPGGPPVRVGADIGELTAGMYAFVGVLATWYRRLGTGLGDRVQLAKPGPMMFLRSLYFSIASQPDDWVGVHCEHITLPPEHGVRTGDWPIYFFSRQGDEARFRSLLARLGLEHLADDPRFANGGREAMGFGRYAAELKPLWEEALASYSAEEALALLREHGAEGAPILDYPALAAHPQIEAIGAFQESHHPAYGRARHVRAPWSIGEGEEVPLRPVPLLGEHTDEVLAWAGYSPREIARLRAAGVVR